MCLCDFFKWILRKVLGIDLRLPIPGAPQLEVFKETDMGLHFKVSLPEFQKQDIAAQELTVDITKQDSEPVHVWKKLDADIVEVTDDLFVAQDGDEVLLSLVYIDANGNRSESRDVAVTVIDTIAPPQPGVFGLTVTHQSFEDDDLDELTEVEDDEVDGGNDEE